MARDVTHSADRGRIHPARFCQPAEGTRRRPVLRAELPVGSAAVADREDLLTMIKQLAVVHSEVILSSGQRADWYVDLRRVLLDGRGAPLAGQVMLDVTAGRRCL